MNIKIPSQTNPILKQDNGSPILGSIQESFNLDLTSTIGKIKVAKSLMAKSGVYSGTSSDWGSGLLPVAGCAVLSNAMYFIAGLRVWIGGNSPSDTITLDGTVGTPTASIQLGDIKAFNSFIWVANSAIITRFSGSWTSTYTLPDSASNLLETHKGYLYFTYSNYKIGRIDTANTVTTSGAGSLNLNLPGFTISWMRSDGQYMWIGLVNTSGGQGEKTYVYKWDGSTTGQAQAQYIIESRGVLSGCLVNGVPHIVDANGRLLGFNGAFFLEIARFPIKLNERFYNGFSSTHDRSISPNGMIYDALNDEILINISNVKSFTSNVPTFFNFPGGVWSYKVETGLLPKYSPSIQPIANNGTTGLTEYGQYNVIFAGFVQVNTLVPASGEKGRIMFSNAYYTGEIADIYTSAASTGLFTDDTANTSQKNGYFVTSEIHSPTITETWQKITGLYSNLLNSSDKIILKYKTRNEVATQVTVTWADMNILTTTDDVSAYTIGDEIQLIQGNGSGKSFHIVSILYNGGIYTIIIDDSMGSGVIGLKGIALFSKWKKIGEILNTDNNQYKNMTIHTQNISPKIVVKVAMQFTGDNELDSIFITSDNTIKE